MDEPSRENGRMRRFQPRSGDINLGAAGGSPCDLCSLRRDAAAETPPTLTHSAVSAPELVFHHTLTDRRATAYITFGSSARTSSSDRFVKKQSNVSEKALVCL